jgi:hypothetical protein
VTPDVHLLMLEYGQARERAALDLLVPMLRRVFPAATPRITIVDNAIAGDGHVSVDAHIDRIGGDNTLREFSGWERGLAWLDRQHAPVRPDKIDRVRALPAARAQEANRGALVGWVDEYPRPVQLAATRFRQWVDTSLLIAERRTFAQLEPLAVAPTAEELFDDDWRRLFREPSLLSENYRTYLRSYFLGDRPDREFEHQWYAQAPLTADNCDALKLKLRCVLCEHLLSARARSQGIPLVDIRPQPLPIDPHSALEVAHGG